jgi:hypothetical protein
VPDVVGREVAARDERLSEDAGGQSTPRAVRSTENPELGATLYQILGCNPGSIGDPCQQWRMRPQNDNREWLPMQFVQAVVTARNREGGTLIFTNLR